MPAQARFGERVPVPVTTFAPIATGGTPQQPITSFNYENIGVNIDITPRTHHDDDVTLALKIAVQSISGTGFGGLPTFGNREINTDHPAARRRDEHAGGPDSRRRAASAGRHSRAERLARWSAGSSRTTKTETKQTDIILTLTPHIIRVLDLDERRPARVPRRPRFAARRSCELPLGRRAAAAVAGRHRPRSRAPRGATASRRRWPAGCNAPVLPSSRAISSRLTRRHSLTRTASPTRSTQPRRLDAPERSAAARRAARSRVRRFRAASARLSPSAASAAAISAIPDRRSRLSSGRPRSLPRTGDDDAVRIAEEQVGAHAAQLLEREQPQLVHPVVHERPPFGLRREHGHEADQVARKPRPQAGGDAAGRLQASTARRGRRRRRIEHSTFSRFRTARDDFHVLGARAAHVDLAAGDRGDDRPAAGLDVVAPQRVRRAPCSRAAAFDANRRSCPRR